MCIWSIYLGQIVGSIPPSFLVACGRMANSLGSNFTDTDNSLPADFAVQLDPDATFLTVSLTSIDLAVRGQGTAVQLALPEGVAIRFDDLASEPFLQHIDIDIPILYVRFLAPLFGRAAPWMEVASLEADFSIILGLSKDGWKARREEQLAFLAKQDDLTKRCPFIYGGGPASDSDFLWDEEGSLKLTPSAPGSVVACRQPIPPSPREPGARREWFAVLNHAHCSQHTHLPCVSEPSPLAESSHRPRTGRFQQRSVPSVRTALLSSLSLPRAGPARSALIAGRERGPKTKTRTRTKATPAQTNCQTRTATPQRASTALPGINPR